MSVPSFAKDPPGALPPLDWRTMPLDGRILIEASAGTGKTWNIGLIYLRLLLERKLRVEQVLVTTFTEAAAQELRERLRRRLSHAIRWLDDAPTNQAEAAEPLGAYLDARVPDAQARRQALRQLQIAQLDLDQAPISTIHALCQRIQRDYPLESGASFAADGLLDDNVLLRECVEDFWRRRYCGPQIDADEADALLAAGPEGLLRDLRDLFNGQARLLDADGLQRIEHLLAQLRAPAAVGALQRQAESKVNFPARRKALMERLADIAHALADESGDALMVLSKRLDKTFAESELPQHLLPDAPLWTEPAFLTLLELRTLLKDRAVFVRGRVLAKAAQFCRDTLPARARGRRVRTYAMLIEDVWQRLCGDTADAALADRLFEAFPVALIDEFQDTDSQQYAIFDRIYHQRGALVMIGDPKQAIYGFRGGDIAAYLRASTQTTQRYSLSVNQRSTCALVSALNSLYGLTQGGFEHTHIRYQPVSAAGRTDAKAPYQFDGHDVERPLSVHLFRDGAVADDAEPDRSQGREARALEDCAERIVALLNDPTRTIAGKGITPGDIAVLLTTNAHVVAMRQQLLRRGVPCVGQGRGGVFDAPIAAELELLLYALIHVEDDQAVRGALSTDLLGVGVAQLQAWQQDAAAFEQQLERFERWRDLVQSRGVLALIESVLSERGSVLLARPEGERTLTDLRHLGELLAAQARQRHGLESLYAWFATMRREGGDGDQDAGKERQLRIESDSQRVQLMTIHASKGLEFPIVFLPLAWRVTSRKPPNDPRLLHFHDETGQACVDTGSAHFAAHRALHFQEDLQERLRLLYVAMTRAVHGLHVYWLDHGLSTAAPSAQWQVPAIDVLLGQACQTSGLPLTEQGVAETMQRLPGVAVERAADSVFRIYQAPRDACPQLAVQSPLPSPRSPQWLHSFSSLTRHASAPIVFAGGGAADEVESGEGFDGDVLTQTDTEYTDDKHLLALAELRGPRFGDAVHNLLELAAPGPLWPDQRHLLQNQLGAQGLLPAEAVREDTLQRVALLVERVRESVLTDTLTLAGLPPEQCVAEFEFQLPVRQLPLARLRTVCAAHGFPELIPRELAAQRLNGMLTGFADLIFAWNGRYHVLDYKTNWLGARQADYADASLQRAMRLHHYPLQALIYTVALHRYLGQRLPCYMPATHLGESWYLFVRAIGLAPGLGIWRQRWPASLIEAFDHLLAGDVEIQA